MTSLRLSGDRSAKRLLRSSGSSASSSRKNSTGGLTSGNCGRTERRTLDEGKGVGLLVVEAAGFVMRDA